MASKIGVVISAAITLILFVGIPYMLPKYIPPEIAAQIAQSGFDLATFTNQVMMIGVVTAAMTIVGGFVDPTSMITLLVKLTQAGFSLILIVVFLGAGNLTSLGYTEFEVAVEGVHNIIAIDLRVFVYVSIATIFLKMVQIYLEWNDAKIEASPPGRIAP